MDSATRRIETDMDDLIREYLERDLVSETAKRRAKRLYSHGDRAAALRLLVDDHKRNRTGDASSADRFASRSVRPGRSMQ